MSEYKSLMIGEKAPHFQANTTYGTINFPEDYKGKWVVFFSHPGDFTPTCTTELMTFASMSDDFAANNSTLLGLSVDSNPSHIDWSRAMERYQWKNIKNPKITFPIVADDLGNIARLYGMLMPTASATRTVRSVFIIDPDGVIRAIFWYPLTTGRNIKEILRTVMALQAYDKTGYATPADWMPGEPQVMPVPQTMPVATERLDEDKKGAISCLDWYLCFTGGTSKPMMKSMPAMSSVVQPEIKRQTVGSNNNLLMNQQMSNENRNAQVIPDISEIMDMIGSAGLNVEMSKMQNDVLQKQMTETKIPAPPVQAPIKAPVKKVAPPSAMQGGIMEQNRMFFSEAIENDGIPNEYRITRDYPNVTD